MNGNITWVIRPFITDAAAKLFAETLRAQGDEARFAIHGTEPVVILTEKAQYVRDIPNDAA